MNWFYLFIAMVVAGNLLYHICQKVIPPQASAILSLTFSYAIAMVASLILFLLSPNESGFLIAYRNGWELGKVALFANVSVTLALIPIGLLFFREQVSMLNLAAVVVAVGGLIMMTR